MMHLKMFLFYSPSKSFLQWMMAYQRQTWQVIEMDLYVRVTHDSNSKQLFNGPQQNPLKYEEK